MQRRHLCLIVSVSGASVLAVEILGARILGPFFGLTLFVWSALIAVTLVALSVGYLLGGRLADRGATRARLCALLLAAGFWLLALPWLRMPVARLGGSFELRLATLVSAFLLFFLPLVLLGMVSPLAVKLRASRVEEVGRSAGDLYAISTAASVAAALLMGLVLVPSVGMSRLALGLGILLIATGAASLLPAAGASRRPSGVDP